MRTIEIPANGIRFAALEDGPADGPLVVLLHGYPDNAYSWEKQIPVLAAAGYRVVAPWLRGYPPTEIPGFGATSGSAVAAMGRSYYDRATLATDVARLIDALNGDEPCLLVGQDWGAAIAYGVLGAYPERVRRAMVLAVPHPVTVRQTLRRSPRHVVRSFHWFLFQLPWLPEVLCRANGYAFLERLWRLWSPDFSEREHVARIRADMATPGALEASLAYYRAMFRASHRDPALADVWSRLDAPINVSTKVLCGTIDMRKELLEPARANFAGEYAWELVDGAGHFLHREKPDVVNRHLLEWLARSIVGAAGAATTAGHG